MKSKKENELLKLSFNNDVQALTDKISDLERIIAGLKQDVSLERRQKEKMIEGKDVEIRNLNTIILDLRDNVKKVDLEYQKQISALEATIQTNKEKFIKEKKEAIEKLEDIIAK